MQDLYVEVDGCRTRYRDSGGDGQAILFIHGIGASLETWDAQAPLADEGYRIIALDLPGHGLSATGDQPYDPNRFADFVLRFMDAIDLTQATLVGNSMGGAIALRMAHMRPQAIDRLLLADAATLGRFSPMPFRMMTLPILGSLMTKPSEAGVKQQVKAIFYRPEKVVTDKVLAVIRRNAMDSERQKAFLATLRLMTDFGGQRQAMIDEAMAALKGLSVPVTFLHGQNDEVIPVQHSKDAQKIVVNASLVILDECGHTPQIEKVADFNRAVTELMSA